MLEALKHYFELVTEYRSPKTNIKQKTFILDGRLPLLREVTPSDVVKKAIGRFLLENTDVRKNSD